MNKWLYRIIGMIISVGIFFVLLFTSMEVIVFNMSYFERHYEERDIMAVTKMSLPDLMYVTEEMMDYLGNKRDTLNMEAIIDGEVEEVFGEREKGHMVDVKDLFIKARWIRNISFVLIIGFLGYGIYKNRKMLYEAFGPVKYVFIMLLMAFGGLGILFYVDFSKYFTLFHEIFFDNDLWLLNPRTDILINMVPEVFFFETAMYSLIIFLSSLLIIGLLVELVGKKRLMKSIK